MIYGCMHFLICICIFKKCHIRHLKLVNLLKCCTQYASKFGKLSSSYRTGKGQFSLQSQRKAMPKILQTTTQLCSLHASKVMLKILQARLKQQVNQELPDVQAGSRRGRETRDQIANVGQIIEKQQNSKKKSIYFCLAQMLKNLPATQETWVRFLGQQMVTYSSTFAWRIPWTGEPGRLQCMGLERVRHN